MGRMSVWGEKGPNGMKSSAVIKCSGQREDGSAPAPGARWVVFYPDKCVALTPGEWPYRHRLKQYLHSFIYVFKSARANSGTSVTFGLTLRIWQWIVFSSETKMTLDICGQPQQNNFIFQLRLDIEFEYMSYVI